MVLIHILYFNFIHLRIGAHSGFFTHVLILDPYRCEEPLRVCDRDVAEAFGVRLANRYFGLEGAFSRSYFRQEKGSVSVKALVLNLFFKFY